MAWHRVSKARPCAICQRSDWCTWADDGAAGCMRCQSPVPMRNGGWLHGQGARPQSIDQTESRPWPDLAAQADEYRRSLTLGHLERLSSALGLPEPPLRSLGLGWSYDHAAWTFPMVGPLGGVVGIRLRYPGGRKLSVKGGREGCFIPTDRKPYGLLVFCEGPTDAAAILSLGFDAVGRPSCSGCRSQAAAMAAGRRVLIVQDADKPGRQGAAALAAECADTALSVSIFEPPQPYNDAREWVASGTASASLLSNYATTHSISRIRTRRPASAWLKGTPVG